MRPTVEFDVPKRALCNSGIGSGLVSLLFSALAWGACKRVKMAPGLPVPV